MQGTKHSEKTKEKIRKAHKGIKTPWVKGVPKGTIPWNKGLKGVQKSPSGANHWNWKGGIAKNRHRGEKYIEWRIKIFQRDNWTCCSCHLVGGKLNAHHIKSWKDYPKLRFDIDNGITCCEKCHKLVHAKDFKKKKVGK